jgi:hypothetical protein
MALVFLRSCARSLVDLHILVRLVLFISFIKILDLFFFIGILNMLYELVISGSALFSEYFITGFKYGIVYIFIYFIISALNISYLGYKRFTFFGILLDDYKEFFKRYFYYLMEFNYFIFIIIYFCILNLAMYYIYENCLVLILVFSFYLIILIILRLKLKWDRLDVNTKTKILNVGLNTVIIMVLGYYINLIIEYLESTFIFKINSFESFLKLFQHKIIANFSYHRSTPK